MGRAEAVSDYLQLRFGRCDGRRRPKTTGHPVDVPLVSTVGIKLFRQVEIRRGFGLIPLLQHSHDNIGLGVEPNGATRQVSVTAEPVAPEVVSHDGEFTGIRRVFFSGKSSPQDGLGPKYIEELPGNVNGAHRVRPLPGTQIETDAPLVVGSHRLEIARLPPG